MADVGEVFVDAGCIWVGDPCYVMGDDASKRVHDWQRISATSWITARGSMNRWVRAWVFASTAVSATDVTELKSSLIESVDVMHKSSSLSLTEMKT